MKPIRLSGSLGVQPGTVVAGRAAARRLSRVLAVLVLSALLIACDAYTETGAKTYSQQDTSGGNVTVEVSSANGTIDRSIEVEISSIAMDVDVTLAVGKGSYKIELLGEDDEVTLTLEARDGQTVAGSGVLVTDDFGEASYRVTATEAENVAYSLDYTFR